MVADFSRELRQTLTATQRRIEELRPHVDRAFEHEEKLQTLRQRQQEIMKALDLTKNQASNQLSAEETPVLEETIQPENVISIEEKPRIRIAAA